MDEEHVGRVFHAVNAAKARGAGAIFVSHRLAEVLAVCDRVHVLRDGASVGEAPTEGLSRERLVGMIVGSVGSDRPARLIGTSSSGAAGRQPVLEIADLKRYERST